MLIKQVLGIGGSFVIASLIWGVMGSLIWAVIAIIVAEVYNQYKHPDLYEGLSPKSENYK